MIKVRDAGFYYRPDTWVFRNYSFALDRGDVLAILGPNGRGKTTLLKALMGLITPQAGTMRVDGERGYVPQTHQVAFAYTVLDMVVMGRARHVGPFSTPSRTDVAAARRALDRVSLGHYAGRQFNQISAGEQQLVMIARALASECDVLLLDEPTSSLDFKNQGAILCTLQRLAQYTNMTIVFATHAPQHAARIASHTLLMGGPTDYHVGPTDRVLTEANLSRLYDVDVRHINFTHNDHAMTTVVPIF